MSRPPSPASTSVGGIGLQGSQQPQHVRGKRRLPLELAAGLRMSEAEMRRVQRLTRKVLQQRGEPRSGAGRNTAATAVDRIADQREAKMRQMHSDLMRAASLEPDIHQGVRAKTPQDPIMGDGATAVAAYGHANPL